MFARKSKSFLLGALAASVLPGCVVVDSDYSSNNKVSCGGNHNLRVVELDMSPDPVATGQRITSFRVKLRADGSGECRTTIGIDDGDRTVAGGTASSLQPGINEITLTPIATYRLDRDEHCFSVKANIANSYKGVDAERQFCAKQAQRGRWTLN